MGGESKLLIANWKMNLSLRCSIDLLRRIEYKNPYKKLVICPPSLHIYPLIKLFSHFNFGAQDCSENSSGSHTGEVSAMMLKEIGCEYVIIGHSERRAKYSESNEIIKKKSIQAVRAGLSPIICIGEYLNDSKENKLKHLLDQLKELDLDNVYAVAYEPVWAIGSGLTPSISDIKYLLNGIKIFYPQLKLLYGGSVTVENSKQLFDLKDINGLLVGGASLDADKLNEILGVHSIANPL